MRREGEQAGVTSNHSFPLRIWARSPPLVLEYSLAIDNTKRTGWKTLELGLMRDGNVPLSISRKLIHCLSQLWSITIKLLKFAFLQD